jgi:hypothetical protein
MLKALLSCRFRTRDLPAKRKQSTSKGLEGSSSFDDFAGESCLTGLLLTPLNEWSRKDEGERIIGGGLRKTQDTYAGYGLE